MRFAVVGCTSCRRVQVIETRTPNVRCRACGAGFAWGTKKRFYEGEDAEEARRVASNIALHAAGAGIEAVAESAQALEAERIVSGDDVIRKLELLSEFGIDDVESLAKVLRFKGSPDRIVAGLRAQQRVFEPRPGRFRWIP